MKSGKRIGEEETKRLSFELSISSGPKRIKRALQDICGHYEKGHAFSDANPIRQLIHSHLDAADILVRRWSLKALGLIGSSDDLHRIANRTKVETDYEAVTWGTAALFANTGSKSLQEIQRDARLDNDKPLLLAARLYGRPDWVRDNLKPVTVSVHDDPLTLKWATFLTGYGRAPADLFDPRYENDVFLAELYSHEVPEISEYSVWALWERDEFSDKHLKVQFDDAHKSPENVRKWLYRLFLQSHEINGLDADRVRDMRLNDNSPAREGLARGIADANSAKFDQELLDWSGVEADDNVKQVLFEGMAKRADDNPLVREIVMAEYEKSSSLRLKRGIIAAASGTGLYGDLRRADFLKEDASERIFDFLKSAPNQIQIVMGGNAQMSNLNVGGNLNAQNVAVGDMIKSANNAIQRMNVEQGSDKEVLGKVVDFLRESGIDAEDTRAAIAAAEKVAQNPSIDNKRGLLEAMKSLGRGAMNVASTGGGIAAILQLLTTWAS